MPEFRGKICIKVIKNVLHRNIFSPYYVDGRFYGSVNSTLVYTLHFMHIFDCLFFQEMGLARVYCVKLLRQVQSTFCKLDVRASTAFNGIQSTNKHQTVVCDQVAKKKQCVRLQLSVLNWNTPSRDFYAAKGAQDLTATEGWHFIRFDGQNLDNLVNEAPTDQMCVKENAYYLLLYFILR